MYTKESSFGTPLIQQTFPVSPRFYRYPFWLGAIRMGLVGPVVYRVRVWSILKDQFQDSFSSCTGTLPFHGVKLTQRTREKVLSRLLTTSVKSKGNSSNGPSNNRAGRFHRNNQLLEVNDRTGSIQTAVLAWLKATVLNATRAIWSKIRVILLRRLKGFSTKKFT